MSAVKILIADDDPNVHESLGIYIKDAGYEAVDVYDGAAAVAAALAPDIALVVLDIMMPVMSGIEACKEIRKTSRVPIIMLTAKGDDMDKILGLEYGADDYMTKPFNILEVKARIKTILRRATQNAVPEDSKVIKVRDLVVNTVNRSVQLNGKDIRLTAKEFDLLNLFITNRGRVFSREEMLDAVWKSDYAGDERTVDVHIRRLREKVERNPTQPEFIFTKWGVGYYFTDRDE